jgi:hypothetical protein
MVMAAKAIVVAVLVVFALCTPWLADTSFAIPIPGYFDGEWVGLLCLQVAFPGADTPINALAQINFDPFTNGGIDLAKADELFAFITDSIAQFGPLAGAGTIQQTCAFTPGQVQSQFGIDALDAANALTGTYQDHGFSLFLILDAFYALLPDYLLDAGLPVETLTLRTDLFIVGGFNDLSYSGSLEVLKELTP